MNIYPEEIYKVICKETNMSLPDQFNTFSESYSALRGWKRQHSIIECYRGEDIEFVYSSEWEENE